MFNAYDKFIAYIKKDNSLTIDQLLNWEPNELKVKYPLLYDSKLEIEEILNSEKSPYEEHRKVDGLTINTFFGLLILTLISLFPSLVAISLLGSDADIPSSALYMARLLLPISIIFLLSQTRLLTSLWTLSRTNTEPEKIINTLYLWSYSTEEPKEKITQPVLFKIIFYLENLYLNTLANFMKWDKVGFLKSIIERNHGYSVIKPNQTNIRVFNDPDNFKFFGTLFYAIRLIKMDPDIYSNPRDKGIITLNLRIELEEVLSLGKTTIGDHIKKALIDKKTPLHLQMEGYEIVQISDKLKIIYEFPIEHRKLSRLQSFLNRFRCTFIANIRA